MKYLFISLVALSVLNSSVAIAQIYAGTRYHAPELQSNYSNERGGVQVQQYNPPQYVPPANYSPQQYRQNYVNQLPQQQVCRIINNYMICN